MGDGFDDDKPGGVGVDARDPVAVGVEDFSQVTLVDDGHTRRESALGLDLHVSQLALDQLRMGECQYRNRVVYGRPEYVVMATGIRAAEELEEVVSVCVRRTT